MAASTSKPAPAPAAAPDPTPATQPPAPMPQAALKAHHSMVKRQIKPWWASLIPDMRGFAAAGFFGMAMYLLYMIGQNAKLLDSAPFMQFAGMIMTGGVLLVGNFLFGGTKSGSDTNAQMVDALRDSYRRRRLRPPDGFPVTLAKDQAPMNDASNMLHHVGDQAIRSAPPLLVTIIATLSQGLPFIISVMTILYIGIQVGYLIWRWHSQFIDRRERRARVFDLDFRD